jgi:hypothetical protein
MGKSRITRSQCSCVVEQVFWHPPQEGNRGVGCQIDLEGVTLRLDVDDRKTLPKRKESINVAPKNAGLLDVFARTNIINQIGVLVSVFPGIP